jgi:hypothetical protein
MSSIVRKPEGVVVTDPAEPIWIATFDGKDFAFLLGKKSEAERFKGRKLEQVLKIDPLIMHGVVVESGVSVRAANFNKYFKGSIDGDTFKLSAPGCSLVLRRKLPE